MSTITLLVTGDPKAPYLKALDRLPTGTRVVTSDDPEVLSRAAPEADVILNGEFKDPQLFKSTFPLAQQVAAGELLVGLGIYHAAQPPLRHGAPIKIVITDPVAVDMLYDIVPAHAKNPSGGELVALWLASPEGAEAYEDATDRGNPLIEGTKTEALLRGRTLAQYPPEQSAREAEVVEHFNKLLESGATQ